MTVNLLLKKNSNSAAALRRNAECIFNRTLTRVYCMQLSTVANDDSAECVAKPLLCEVGMY